MTIQPQPYQPAAQLVPRVVPRPLWPGVLISFLVPGVGSMMNGSALRGTIILVLWIVGAAGSLFLIGLPVLFGAWIWGMIDGALSAKRWNHAHGIIS